MQPTYDLFRRGGPHVVAAEPGWCVAEPVWGEGPDPKIADLDLCPVVAWQVWATVKVERDRYGNPRKPDDLSVFSTSLASPDLLPVCVDPAVDTDTPCFRLPDGSYRLWSGKVCQTKDEAMAGLFQQQEEREATEARIAENAAKLKAAEEAKRHA